MNEQKEYAQFNHDLGIEQQEHQAATQMAAEQAQELVKNPKFLAELQEADLDSDVFDWVEDELGPLVSGAHIIGNRSEHYEEQQMWLNRNKVERMICERSPGRLLRENREMHALAQGVRHWKVGEGPESDQAYRAPITSRKKRVVRDSEEVITSRQSLSIDGRGLDAVANATVENRSVQSEQQQSDMKSRASKVFE